MTRNTSDYLETLIWHLIDREDLQELSIAELKAVLEAASGAFDSGEVDDEEPDYSRYVL